MKQELISIGEMAKINQISVPTLRLYDQDGLLKPAYTDPDTGYRYYTLQQNARLDMIAYMKELGMSLAEIRRVLDKEDIALIESILGQKNEQLHEQIRQMKMRHDAVARAIACIERYRKSPVTGTISLEYIDQRYIWSIPCPTNFYEEDITSYEQALVKLRQELMRISIPQIHTYNIGTSILREHFEQEQFVADQIFIFSDRRLLEYEGHVSPVESGMYACIYLDNYDDEIAYGKKLLSFCREHGYRISGDYICEVMTEFNVFDNSKRNMFLRLQVPINFSQNP